MKTYVYEVKYRDPVTGKYETKQIHIKRCNVQKAQLAMLRTLDTLRLQHKQIIIVELIQTLQDEHRDKV